VTCHVPSTGVKRVYRRQWLALLVLAALGFAGYAGFSSPRAGLSYMGGVIAAGLAFTAGIAAVRWADRFAPATTMMVALLTYATIALLFAALFARYNPDVLDGSAFALGLVVAVIAWIALQLRMAWTRKGR
jgi:hypothetical protein